MLKDKEFHKLTIEPKGMTLALVTNTEYVKTSFRFFNHFHPFTAEMIEQLNKKSLAGLFDVDFQRSLERDFFEETYKPNNTLTGENQVEVLKPYPKKEVDLNEDGPYAVYNWELLFHAPLSIANHLYKNQRYDEAEKYLKLIFDPTTNEKPLPENPFKRFWKFKAFRDADLTPLETQLRLLSSENDEDQEVKLRILKSIEGWRNQPFQPHVVARSRFQAYQYKTVMLWLDIYMARGDSFFRQFTSEAIDTALINYVQVSNFLGQRPQQIPKNGRRKPETFRSLRQKMDGFGNAIVDLEAEFPLNLHIPVLNNNHVAESSSLFGLSRTLYFCIPQNDKLLNYWNLVADRLYKIRSCLNIDGIEQTLALFDPPLDPGRLVEAAKAGLDISSILNGLNQPVFAFRSPLLIQKAIELANEVKGLGAYLLSTIEKQESEKLALLRYGHEQRILQLGQDIKFMQWKEAENSTETLLQSHQSTFLRFKHYQNLLGKPASDSNFYGNISAIRNTDTLDQERFEAYYDTLINDYKIQLADEEYRQENLGNQDVFVNNAQKVAASAPGLTSVLPISNDGANLGLNTRENIELNVYMPIAHELTRASGVVDAVAGLLSLIPEVETSAKPMGVGAAVEYGGRELSTFAATSAKIIRIVAEEFNYMGGRASKLAGYQRRNEEWVLQSNLALNELKQVRRQVVSSLIREAITRKEYETHIEQVEHAAAVNEFYQNKFTSEEFYRWMQNELSKIYFDAYKFAFDIAKKAEYAMKRELMWEEVSKQVFVKYGYWNDARKGMLAGENLFADLRRMEVAYQEYNRREYEITKHISLMQLNPYALLQLKIEGKCTLEIPEWIFDLDNPGQYMRRIKMASFSIPCVAGPFTSISCKATLNKSSIRTSPLLNDGNYTRNSDGDERFTDLYSATQTIVTSTGQNDSGMFEPNLKDERYLPFEGSGTVSTWTLELNSENRQFDYASITDVIIHLRYTSRESGILKSKAQETIRALLSAEENTQLFRLYHIPNEFSSEWQNVGDSDALKIGIKKAHLSYLSQFKKIVIQQIITIYPEGGSIRQSNIDIPENYDDINDPIKGNKLNLDIPKIIRGSNPYLLVCYRYDD